MYHQVTFHASTDPTTQISPCSQAVFHYPCNYGGQRGMLRRGWIYASSLNRKVKAAHAVRCVEDACCPPPEVDAWSQIIRGMVEMVPTMFWAAKMTLHTSVSSVMLPVESNSVHNSKTQCKSQNGDCDWTHRTCLHVIQADSTP